MSRKNPHAERNREFFEPFLEGFTGQYGIELQIFGDNRLHWRLSNDWAIIDIWPTTGKFYIKEFPMWQGFTINGRGGTLPQDYNKMDKFLKALFVVKEIHGQS